MVMYDSATSIARFAIAILTGSAVFMTGCSDTTTNNSPAVSQTQATDNSPAIQSVGFETDHMAWIPGGTFAMGSDDEKPDERPIHQVTVAGFWMDKTEVTNRQFAEFVNETKYVTVAEQKPDPLDFPGVPADKLVPGAVVFDPPPGNVPLNNHRAWWVWRQGADWQHPTGPDDSIDSREEHPVVNVCWFDAMAYAEWMTKRTGVTHRLPTEAEWEFAARGGLDRKKYIWGEELKPDEKCIANFWQGRFPNQNTIEDGFRITAEQLDEICAGNPGQPRILVLNDPSNPTGRTYPGEELQQIAEVARRHRVVVLSDEIYGKLHHDGEHVSIVPMYPEGTIFSGGLSSWSLFGRRFVGFGFCVFLSFMRFSFGMFFAMRFCFCMSLFSMFIAMLVAGWF